MLGALAGLVNALVAAMLAQEKPLELFRRRGLWFWLALALGPLLGLYEIWLLGGMDADFWCMLLLWGCLFCATVSDLTDRTIRTIPMLGYGLVLLVYQFLGYDLAVGINSLIGALVGLVVLGLPRLIRPTSVGGGDLLMLVLCGIGAGFPGVLYVLFRGMVALAVTGVVLLLLKRADRHAQLPLAPFLLFGVLI